MSGVLWNSLPHEGPDDPRFMRLKEWTGETANELASDLLDDDYRITYEEHYDGVIMLAHSRDEPTGEFAHIMLSGTEWKLTYDGASRALYAVPVAPLAPKLFRALELWFRHHRFLALTQKEVRGQ